MKGANDAIRISGDRIASHELHSMAFVLLATLSTTVRPVSSMELGGATSTNGPQPCPGRFDNKCSFQWTRCCLSVNPIQLVASSTPQYIHSPYDMKSHLYLPNSDCKFLLRASSKEYRLHITVLASDLEEPLFQGHCSDYCSLRDGADASARQIVRWCGKGSPTSITSSSNALYLHFHSDAVVQRRGFNISFVEFELPGCPPGWFSDPQSSSHSAECFKLMSSEVDGDGWGNTSGSSWLEAQRQCNYEKANLATFNGPNDYESVLDAYASASNSPWIGYSNAFGVEGTGFKTADNSSTLWPEDFPTFNADGAGRQHGCLYLDWTLRGQEQFEVAYAMDQCWHRRAFICKKNRGTLAAVTLSPITHNLYHSDGTTIPEVFSEELLRTGISSSSSSGLNLLLLLLIALLVIIVLLLLVWLCYRQYKRRKTNRVSNVDQNQRLVSGLPTTAPTVHQQPSEISEPRRSTEQSGGAITRGGWSSSAHLPSKIPLADMNINQQQLPPLAELHQEQRPPNELVEDEEYAMESPRISVTPNQPGAYANASQEVGAKGKDHAETNHFQVVVSREDTNVSAQNITAVVSPSGGWAGRLNGGGRRRRREFERPHVKTLESVSAISLDEFWQQK